MRFVLLSSPAVVIVQERSPCTCVSGTAVVHLLQMQDRQLSLSGKVVETMNSGGYTYVSLESNGKKTWVAVPATAVKVGQR